MFFYFKQKYTRAMEESSTTKKPNADNTQVDKVNNTLENLNINKDSDKEQVSKDTLPPITLPNVVSQCQKDEYLVKTVDWKDKKIRIITQNGNELTCFICALPV